ncbi:M3 family oligoendopeptidase [Planococcus citreus]|uniref:PepF/M3 family oligoendopeptidase n=1 Tax=Planococcus citreus TaxID=1373 RepID=A0A497YC55_9BACL|nr:M3 family oligoendopeptidase [Planococcus citreus]RLJ81624.1 pepF/M3 family oligoendopeptidase [Planococcus citreus]
MTNTYPEVWELDSLFSGGSDSAELRTHLEATGNKLADFEQAAATFDVPNRTADAQLVAAFLEQTSDVSVDLRQAGAFIGCLMAQNTEDKKAALLQSEHALLRSRFQSAFLKFKQVLMETDPNVWSELLSTEDLQEFAFVLDEWRKEAQRLLSEQEEGLITSLGIDGYHAWSELYDLLIASVSVQVDVDGEDKTLSVGQANNLSSHQDASVRKEAYDKLEAAWGEKEELFAKTLNSLAGFRLQMYKKRGVDNVLEEPLQMNRMKQETLDVMWQAISEHKQPFADYLARKAQLLGKEKLAWYDVDAPVVENSQSFDYEQGSEFIIRHFGKFGPELEKFSRHALENGWVEAEDRAHKMPGGFCTSLPKSGESRIFMTYSGSMSNVATLAHELGHAFHTHALQPMHDLNRSYAMNVAETASTFAEMIVADAAVKNAVTKEEKISLLEDKIQRSVAFFMNIHARFLFETRFYEERKNGVVPASRLNELMEQAQEEAFAGSLSEGHPHFWASKLHFYITDVPFYNFPYTFGYLFSLSVYAKALEEGQGFEEKYMALLRDTAVMSTEQLAMKHLGEDITEKGFWEKGIALCTKDVEEFIKLTAEEG